MWPSRAGAYLGSPFSAEGIRPTSQSSRAGRPNDGSGYPDDLAGDEIPLGARIIFACDAYDAMTSDRAYRTALSQARACAELERHAGTQFDPRVVSAVLSACRPPKSSTPT